MQTKIDRFCLLKGDNDIISIFDRETERILCQCIFKDEKSNSILSNKILQLVDQYYFEIEE